MRIACLAISAAAVISTSALSQQSGSFQGKWAGSMPGERPGNVLEVELTLKDSGGKWHMRPEGRKFGKGNPCLDRDLPVTVTSQSASELKIGIHGAKVVQGCIDRTASLKALDAKTLEGTLDDGRVFKLVRK